MSEAGKENESLRDCAAYAADVGMRSGSFAAEEAIQCPRAAVPAYPSRQ